jgi:enoyl-[acyl-carrier protein] reductase/trans-2-enoyl-CoA reductase (NAD+)
MSLEVVSPRLRGFICVNAHPAGCAENVALQVRQAKGQPWSVPGGNALIVGASTGYGLASWITAAFAGRMGTLGVFLERPPAEKKTATAGFYNAAAVLRLARGRGPEGRGFERRRVFRRRPRRSRPAHPPRARAA